jgi:branched-chain amino acid transport system permease protein
VTTTSIAAAPAAADAIPSAAFDWRPIALLAAVMALAVPAVGSTSSWITLTVAGLSMGLIVFVIASGLTLIFGLMDVLNFGHGVFIALGAFVATSVVGYGAGAGWSGFAGVFAAMVVAMAVAGAVGWAFERVIVRPVYGQHLKQILITMGGMIVGEEIIKVIWGPLQIALPLPDELRGAWYFGDAGIEKYRVMAAGIGLLVLAVLVYTLNRTKIGLLIRAGVQDRSRRWATASGGCSSACSSPARRWPGSAACCGGCTSRA